MIHPYALLSDQHAHNWSVFATTGSDGVNSRLRKLCNEMERAATELKAAGGSLMVFAGDLFHERGKIDPEVFNPVHDTIAEILNGGVEIIAIPGNHDLKGRETTKLGNAMQSLGKLPGFRVITAPAKVTVAGCDLLLVPWMSSTFVLKALLDSNLVADSNTDLILHAGIDGVLPGMPDHGLSSAYLAGLGFRRVFAGHYHHHKVMENGKVVSIGAMEHQTWRDVGSKAGFLLVYPDRIDYRASHSPEFVEITGDTKEEDIPLLVDGNYVRIRGRKITNAEVDVLRGSLRDMGAVGTTIEVLPEEIAPRTGSVKASTISLESSVDSYVDSLSLPTADQVKSLANDILTGVKSVAA